MLAMYCDVPKNIFPPCCGSPVNNVIAYLEFGHFKEIRNAPFFKEFSMGNAKFTCMQVVFFAIKFIDIHSIIPIDLI